MLMSRGGLGGEAAPGDGPAIEKNSAGRSFPFGSIALGAERRRLAVLSKWKQPSSGI